jgi:hypothetical protein
VTRAKTRAPQDEVRLHPEERPSSGRVTKDASQKPLSKTANPAILFEN